MIHAMNAHSRQGALLLFEKCGNQKINAFIITKIFIQEMLTVHWTL